LTKKLKIFLSSPALIIWSQNENQEIVEISKNTGYSIAVFGITFKYDIILYFFLKKSFISTVVNRSLEQMDCVILEEVSGENITDSNPFSAFGNQTITDKKKDIKLDNNQLLDFLANNNLLFSKKGYKSVISGNRYRKLFSDRCIIKNTSSGTTTTTLTSIDKDACENSPYSGNWHSYEPTISVVEVGQAVDDNSNISPFSNIVINDSDDDEVIVKVTLDNVDGGSFSELSGFTDKLDGTFTLDTTSDSHAQASLRGMVFTPDENQLPAGSIDISRLTIHLNESLPNDDTSDDTTTIITTSVNDGYI